MDKVKKILLSLIVIALICAIVAIIANFVLSKTDNKSNPIVTMEIEGYGTVKIELYPDMAPNTVKNFIRLAQRGFYNGKTFNDIEDGLVRGGAAEDTQADTESEETEDTESTIAEPKLSNIKDLAEGEEDKSYSIEGEFVENGYNNNTLAHQRGVISMYRKTSSYYQQEIAMVEMMGYESYLDTILDNLYDSQTSEFFILTEDNSNFNGTFAAFGKVIEGMDVIDKISEVELQTTTSDDGTETTSTKPVTAPVISSVTVDTFGVDYGEPEVVDLFDFDAIFNVFMQSYMQSAGQTTTAE